MFPKRVLWLTTTMQENTLFLCATAVSTEDGGSARIDELGHQFFNAFACGEEIRNWLVCIVV